MAFTDAERTVIAAAMKSPARETMIAAAKMHPTLSDIYKAPAIAFVNFRSVLNDGSNVETISTDEDKGHVMETDEQIVNKMMPLIDAVIELQKVVSLLPKAQEVKKVANTVSLLKAELEQVVANQESKEPEPPKRKWWKL